MDLGWLHREETRFAGSGDVGSKGNTWRPDVLEKLWPAKLCNGSRLWYLNGESV